MISGQLNDQLEAIIRILIRNQNGAFTSIDAIIDTGFDGSLTLPKGVIAALGLTWRGKSRTLLANGMVDECDVYACHLQWDGRARNVLVEAADIEPLIGMAMMQGFELRMQIKAGGNLTLVAMRE